MPITLWKQEDPPITPLTIIKVRQRISGGFRTAQINKNEEQAFSIRAAKTMRAREDIAEFQHEYVDRLENQEPDTTSYLSEKIGLLMKLGEQARIRGADYLLIVDKHETLRQAYQKELKKRHLPTLLRQDIADAYEQHTALLKDLDGAVYAESETYQVCLAMIEKLEPRLMIFYEYSPRFPIFEQLDAQMREQARDEAYEEGEIDLDEANDYMQETNPWKPTRH